MRFSREYSKLKKKRFTTIRKNTGYYDKRLMTFVQNPSEKFFARILSVRTLKKAEITEELALSDADMPRERHFVLIELERDFGNAGK